ncbi:hypothetical protein ACLMJK_004737 [Lecanora helva]
MGTRWPSDFNQNGKLLRNRPNRGRAATKEVRLGKETRLCDMIVDGTYILHGDKGALATNVPRPWLCDIEDEKTWSVSWGDESEYAESKYLAKVQVEIIGDSIRNKLFVKNAVANQGNSSRYRKTAFYQNYRRHNIQTRTSLHCYRSKQLYNRSSRVKD